MSKGDERTGPPFLNSKMLDINMARTRGRAVLIDDGNGCLIVHVQFGRLRLSVAQFREDHAETKDHFGCKDSGQKFGFSAGSGNSGLEFALVCDGASAQIDIKASDGTSHFKVSTMCRINIGSEIMRQGKVRKIVGFRNNRKMNGWEIRQGTRASIDNTPILGSLEIAGDMFELSLIHI